MTAPGFEHALLSGRFGNSHQLKGTVKTPGAPIEGLLNFQERATNRMWNRLVKAADAGEQLYLNSDLRRDIVSLARSNELLRMRLKATQRERDALQTRLIKRAIADEEAKTKKPKMLRQRDDYRKYSTKHRRR